MEFDPNNNVIILCLQGMDFEAKNKPEDAGRLFLQAWNEATNYFEKFIAAHYVARHQKNAPGTLMWLETMLGLAIRLDNSYASGVLPALYSKVAKCYEDLNEP